MKKTVLILLYASCYFTFSYNNYIYALAEEDKINVLNFITHINNINTAIWQAGISRMIYEKEPGMPCVLVDGIIGTGYEFARPLPPNLTEITAKIEEGHSRGARVIAIDIPTGVDCDTGEADPGAISADLTLSFILPKKGITILPGKQKAGAVRVPTIGLPINIADLILGPVPEEPEEDEEEEETQDETKA